MDSEIIGSSFNNGQRFILGCFVLLLVDVIWVSSSELTKFIYQNEQYEKPFFCTYLKTSMFTLYLLGFCFWPPWREGYCNKPHNYMFIDPDQEDENFYSEANTSLSNPVYVPVKTPERETVQDRSSGTESDDSSIRSVRFNKLAEVRHMSELEATEALLARLSYQASVRADEIAKRAAIKLPIMKVAKIAFIFCLLWFAANYTFQLALAETEAGMVTVLSSTSSLFTLVLAAIYPSGLTDKFTLSKLVAVIISIIGVILISLSGISMQSQVPLGIILSILSAFFYATYIVFLKRKVEHEDKMDIPLFFGFVGLFNLILLWPLFFFFHYSNWEHFELPTKHQLMFLLVNGILGTVISEALWLWGCFLTSSLMATVAISLTIPMTMLADVFLQRVTYPCLFYLGTVPMIFAFVAVSFLSHYDNWDPVMEFLRCACNSVFRRRYRSASEGLRKLAVTYKNTVQGKAELDRFRSTYKSSKKPIDPRFRRVRTAPPGETTTKSDMKIQSQAQGSLIVTARQPMSTPAVSSLPATPKRNSPRRKLKSLAPRCHPQSRDTNDLTQLLPRAEPEPRRTEIPVPIRVQDEKVEAKPRLADKAISIQRSATHMLMDVKTIKEPDTATALNKTMASIITEEQFG